jgi:sphinganine-1-phosphate aldolase
MISIPQQGRAYQDVLSTMTSFCREDVNYLDGRTWSLVYHLGEDHTRFLQQAHNLYFNENALNPMAFKSLKRFEHEVVSMAGSLLHGEKDVVGTMTSGGTESCLLPVFTYREKALSRSGLRTVHPEMVAPETVHVAWAKAARYFGVKLVTIPVNRDYQMDLNRLEKKINRHTIMIVASAPGYPHGIIDPIAQIGEIAAKRQIPFHVDACLGGFLLPFMEQIGYTLPVFDFRVKGVTSMSADLHKYGFAAKGASVLLYRNMTYLRHQFFIHQNWPGGVFASPGLLGTRPGGPIAAAWAALNAIGQQGYKDIAGRIMGTTEKLIAGINAIDGLAVMGAPHASVFGYHSVDPKVNIFAVGDVMDDKGWHIDRLQRPEGLHAMVTPAHENIADQYLADLAAAVDQVKDHPDQGAKGSAAMYGMIARVPFRGMIRKQVLAMMEKMYGPACEMPMESSQKNPWTMRLMARFVNLFFSARRR